MTPTNTRVLKAGYLFFFLSGATALVYEIIWLRLLGLVFGNTTYAISTVLAAFMAGLGLGSFFIGSLADRWKNHLKTYGLLELGIGIYSALTFVFIKGVETLYLSVASPADPNTAGLIFFRILLSSIIIFIPTFFMGATLPVLVKFFIARDNSIGRQTALLYGLNTAGAVTGTLLTGFWLLPNLGMRLTLGLAVTINLVIGLAAFVMSRGMGASAPARHSESAEGGRRISSLKAKSFGANAPQDDGGAGKWLLVGLFLSGAAAMAYEIGWTRTLAIVLGSSTYAFTMMLATFLFGMAAGSAAYERILKRREATVSDWGWLQWAIAAFSLFSLPLFERVPLWMVRFFALTIDAPFFLDFLRFGICSVLMFIPAFCFGAIFPVSAALYARDPAKAGHGVGTLYLFNTFGNILGSLTAGFLLIPFFGIHKSLVLTSLLSGLLGLGVLLGRLRTPVVRRIFPPALAAILLTTGFWINQNGWDPRLITSGLHIRPRSYIGLSSKEVLESAKSVQVLYYHEGLTSIVSVGQSGDHRFLKVNGKTDASTGQDMFTQLLSGHLPHLFHPNPERTLVIGFGSGATVAASLAYPIKELDAVEIEEGVLKAAPFFDAVNRKAYKDARVRIVVNDGRNHLLLQKEPYDVIISEPSNPWMAGTANLFTVEFYDLVRQHLTTDGILCQWLQAYAIAPDDFQMVVGSVQKVFPHVQIWQSMAGDTLILASPKPLTLDLGLARKRWENLPRLRQDLESLGITGPAGVLSFFMLGEKDVKIYTKEALLNTDDRLLLEFNAPKSLYRKGTAESIRQILKQQRSEELAIEPSYENLLEIGEGFLAQEGKESEARIYLENNLELKPNDSRSLLGIGRSFMKEGLLLRAMSFFEAAIQENPKFMEGYAYFGLAYYKGGYYQKSLEMFEKSLVLKETPEVLYWKSQAEKKL